MLVDATAREDAVEMREPGEERCLYIYLGRPNEGPSGKQNQISG